MSNNESDLDADVGVVGYGPVGQALTLALAIRGYRVVTFEQHPRLYGLPRAGHCDGETMRLFQSLQVADQLELLIRPLLSYELVSRDWEVLQRIPIGRGGFGWKASYLFHQPEMEQVLDQAVRSQDTASVRMDSEVVGLKPDSDHVLLDVKHGERSGAEPGARKYRVQYVVGADGANSFVREILGIERSNLGFPPIPNLVVDFAQSAPDRDRPQMGEVRQVMDPDRPQLSGRWNGNRWSRWEFLVMPGEDPDEINKESRIWELLRDWSVGPEDGEIIRSAIYVFESNIAERWRDGRVLLVGDAAHTMPPFMGQGMCEGLRDVLNLTWKLDAVMSGLADSELLDSYEIERATHTRQMIERSMAVGEAVTTIDHDEARRRDERLRQERESVVPEEPTEIPLGPGLVHTGRGGEVAAPAGEMGPQFRAYRWPGDVQPIEHDPSAVALMDDLLPNGWTLFSRERVDWAELLAVEEDFLNAIGMTFVHVGRGCYPGSLLDLEAGYEEWFQQRGLKHFIQRPDFHVFGACDSDDELGKLVANLRETMTRYGLYTP